MKKLLVLLSMLILLVSFASAGMKDGLRMAMEFNDSTDSTGNFSFTEHGTLSYTTSGCVHGKCYQGSSSDSDYIDTASTAVMTGLTDWTMSTWVYLNDNGLSLPYEYARASAPNEFYMVYASPNWLWGYPAAEQIVLPFASTTTWVSLIVQSNSSGVFTWKDGVLDQSDNVQDGAFPDGIFAFFRDSVSSGRYMDGKVDDSYLWDRALTTLEIKNLAAQNDSSWWSTNFGDAGAPVNATLPVYEYPTPADGVTNNTQASINISCATGNVTLWLDANADPITKVIDAANSPANYTTSFATEQTYYYKASCDQGLNNGTTRTFIYDITSPAITINPNNEFTATNITPDRYNNNITLDITFTDNIDLFALNVLFTSDVNGSVVYNFTNSSLTGLTSYTLLQNIDVSAWPVGNFTVDVSVSDSHTDKYIKPYKESIKNKELEFETEHNKVKIYTDEDSTPSIEKKKDRYEFDFEFTDKTKKDRIFYVECDHELYYLKSSEFSGHLVCFNPGSFDGNWIDY